MTAIKQTREKFGRFFYRFPEGESAADVYDRVSSEFCYDSFFRFSVRLMHGVCVYVNFDLHKERLMIWSILDQVLFVCVSSEGPKVGFFIGVVLLY